MNQLIAQADFVLECHAARLFKKECVVDLDRSKVSFEGKVVFIHCCRKAIALALRQWCVQVARQLVRWDLLEARISWHNSRGKRITIPQFLAYEELLEGVVQSMFESTPPRIATPSLFIGIMRLTPALTSVLDYMLSNPEKKVALTRIQDNAQLILTEAAAKAMKSDGETAVKRRTDDFWLGEDLEKLQQMYRDYGEVESGFEITYTATLDKPKHDPTASWGVWTAHYILKKDNFGLVYRQGELIDLKEISRPLVVA
jgi:hypothetical protein